MDLNELTKLVQGYAPGEVMTDLGEYLKLIDAHRWVGQIELCDPEPVASPRDEPTCWLDHDQKGPCVSVTFELGAFSQAAHVYPSPPRKVGISIIGVLEERILGYAREHGITYLGRHRNSGERSGEVSLRSLQRVEELVATLRAELAEIKPDGLERLTNTLTELRERITTLEKASQSATSGESAALTGDQVESRAFTNLRQQVHELRDAIKGLARPDPVSTNKLEQRCSQLDVQVGQLRTDVQGVRATMDGLTKRSDAVGELERRLDASNKIVDALAARVEELGRQANGITSQLDQLSQQVQDLHAAVVKRPTVSSNGHVEKLEDRLTKLEAQLASVAVPKAEVAPKPRAAKPKAQPTSKPSSRPARRRDPATIIESFVAELGPRPIYHLYLNHAAVRNAMREWPKRYSTRSAIMRARLHALFSALAVANPADGPAVRKFLQAYCKKLLPPQAGAIGRPPYDLIATSLYQGGVARGIFDDERGVIWENCPDFVASLPPF